MLVSVVRVAALLALLAFAATACGSSHPRAQATTTTTAAASKRCTKEAAALAKINADIAALQHAKKGAESDHATDTFLLDVATAPISNLQRNRLIDHAAAAVSTKCPQCFQAMESERPIPAIAHVGNTGCGHS
jgi:hypothetical protein